MNKKVNILHLSDMHFGAEPNSKVTSTHIAQRENALNSIFALLNELDPEWKPQVIVISGDIGWKGASEDYNCAKGWLKVLLNTLHLSSSELIICAGNHDLNRKKATGISSPMTAYEADEWLSLEHLENFIRPFESYNEFCTQFSIPSLSLGTQSYNLIGARELSGLRFVVLNSAWFSRGDDDRGKLWLGLPQLQVMENTSQIVKPEKYNDDLLTIAIMHHPISWLHDSDQNSYETRTNTYRYLAERCHIILSGHVHGAIESPHRIHERAYLFTGGATYAGANYRNNFSILQIETQSRMVIRRSFEYDPRYSTECCIDKFTLSTIPQRTTESIQAFCVLA